MSRRHRSNLWAMVLGGLLLVGLALLVIKWLLITAAILAVPFGIWWLFDREKRLSDQHDVQRRQRAPIDYEVEAKRAEDADMPASARLWREQSDPWKA